MRATRRSDNAVVLFRGDSAFAWSGRLRIAVDSLSGPTGVAGTPFYLGLYATAGADTGGPGSQRAIATRLLYAVPPADGLENSIAGDVAARSGIAGFRLLPAAEP